MKRNLLLITIVLLSFGNVFAQDYHPFLNNSSWSVSNTVSCCRPTIIETIDDGSDVVIGAYTYKKYNDPFPGNDSNFNLIENVYLREDVGAKKVYKIVDGVDVLLYDFSFVVGSTIRQYGFDFTVTLVEDIAVNGGTRKKITLRSDQQYSGQHLKQVWIEGVGSLSHPFYPERNMYNVVSSGGGISIKTKCSFQNGGFIYGNAADCGSSLGIDENLSTIQNISFSPNPFATELRIESEIAFQDVSVQLYNAVGQLVRENLHQSGNTITLNRGNLQSGLYFIQVTQGARLLKAAKIMVD